MNVAVVVVIVASHACTRAGSPPPPRACIVLAAGPVWYVLRPAIPDNGVARIAIVQPGVIHGPTDRFDAGERITRSLVGKHLDLVVWGESSVGFDLERRPDLLARLQRLSRQVGTDILVNVDARRKTGGDPEVVGARLARRASSAATTRCGSSRSASTSPCASSRGWVSRITKAAKQDRRRGHDLTVLDTDGLKIGPLVCFESSFPDMSRNLANRGVDLIVVQSATSTFQDSWAPAQHASLAPVRAMETGHPVVHATLTGETAVSDATGRRLAHLSTHRRGSAVVTVPLAHEKTVYDRLGEWVPALSFTALTVAGMVVGVRRARRQPGGAPQEAKVS